METATQLVHRLSSMTGPWWTRERALPGGGWGPPVDDPRVLQGLEANDFSRFPWFTKRYPETLPRIALPVDLPETRVGALVALAGNATDPAPLDLGQLARILHLSAGVVRTAERSYGTYLFRAAGSAGGRFPLELYVAVPDGAGTLPPGVHWFDPIAHALVLVGPPPRGDAPTLVVTGIPWRTAWRYRERGFRHVYWDAGSMLAQTVAVAAAAGLTPRLVTRFPDGSVSDLVGADGVHEWPVALVVLGPGAPVVEGAGLAEPGAVDADPVELPLVTAAQHAGDGSSLGEAWPAGEPVDVPSVLGSPSIDATVLRRGSQRRMVPHGRLPAEVVGTSMDVAMRGVEVPHWVAALRVDGMEPGLYRWPDLASPVRSGDLHDELYWATSEQELGREAAFDVIGAADLEALDDRGYREAQLASGIVEGRLHLAAYALGASATGMTFLDDAITTLLGERFQGLLMTCVGVPEYASAAGGPPGRPTPIRMITPRGE